MCSTACFTDRAPGRPVRTSSSACVGRRRAMPNSTATKKPFAATSSSARMIFPAVTGPAYGTAPQRVRRLLSDGRFGGLGVRQARPHVGRVLVGAGDQLVPRLALVLRQEARLHAEVHGLRVVGHDRDG